MRRPARRSDHVLPNGSRAAPPGRAPYARQRQLQLARYSAPWLGRVRRARVHGRRASAQVSDRSRPPRGRAAAASDIRSRRAAVSASPTWSVVGRAEEHPSSRANDPAPPSGVARERRRACRRALHGRALPRLAKDAPRVAAARRRRGRASAAFSPSRGNADQPKCHERPASQSLRSSRRRAAPPARRVARRRARRTPRRRPRDVDARRPGQRERVRDPP